MANHLRFTAKGWKKYTGEFCMVQFVDGVSVEPLPRNVMDRIASMLPAEIVDENGVPEGEAGPIARYLNMKHVEIEIPEPLDRMTPAELRQERRDALARALRNPAQRIYTKQELEAIAELEGIKGLRAIGDLWGVRDRAINNLIFEILKAQSEYMARVDEREAIAKRRREAAVAETLRLQKEHEAEIDKQARLVGNLLRDAETTPNAIGPDGKPVHTDPNTKPVINPELLTSPDGAVTIDLTNGVTSIDYTKIDGAT
jgi:hypothetical protein